MTDIIRRIQQRAARYEVNASADVSVTIRMNDDSSSSVSAELVNLSTCGAKFKTSCAFPVKEVVTVEINVKHPRRTIAVSADVCWTSPVAGDGWWLGCSLKPPIPEEVLQEFAKTGIIERREHLRKRVSLKTVAKWELTSTTTPAQLLDYSPGGFCILLKAQATLGERVQVRIAREEEPDILVRGKALWQVESGDGYVVGCEIIHPQDVGELSELDQLESATESDATFNSNWLTSRFLARFSGDDSVVHRMRRGTVFVVATAAVAVLSLWLWRSLVDSSPGARVDRPAISTELTSSGTPTAAFPDMTSPVAGGPFGDTDGFDPTPVPRFLEVRRQGVKGERQPYPPAGSPRPAGASSSPHLGPTHRSAPAAARSRHYLVGVGQARLLADRQGQVRDYAGPPRNMPPHSLTPVVGDPLPIVRGRSQNADPEDAFRESRDLYLLQQYERAATALLAAIQHDNENAEYRYLLAMIQYRQGHIDQAEHSVRKAVELEQEQPIELWGKTMERYQGEVRVWLEETRRRMLQSPDAMNTLARPSP